MSFISLLETNVSHSTPVVAKLPEGFKRPRSLGESHK